MDVTIYNLIFKNYIKKVVNNLLYLPLENNYFIRRISRIIEKTFSRRFCYPMFALYEFKYSSILSFRLKLLSFNFEHESVTLKSLRMQLIRKKVIPERRYFSWQKWDLGCEKHPTWLYFKWENINGFLFKHPVYGKEYKLPHIINLLISQIIRNNSLGILATKFWKFLRFLFRFNFLGITCKKFSVPKVSLFSLVRNILSGSFRMSTLCGHAEVSWNQTHLYIQ